MCGIAGMFGPSASVGGVAAMVAAERHRGPDAEMTTAVAPGVVFGHARLGILDLSDAGRQPMTSATGQTAIIFNGEIYNYLELRRELVDYPYRTGTDTEVVLAAYERWGEACLDRLLGMFAFAVWDARRSQVFAARDRFGVKPLFFHQRADGTLMIASEVKALHAAGVPAEPDAIAWSSYLAFGALEASSRTFWTGISSLPAGHACVWRPGTFRTWRWYDLAARVGPEFDGRPEAVVRDEYRSLLEESVALRFRSDVPVGVNLSGGLDSSVLLGLIHRVQPSESDVTAFTFVTGDPQYDELPWVEQALSRTRHPLVVCRLEVADVPRLVASVHRSEDGPFGGLPTVAYARVFEEARRRGVIVLLDGQGMDEQWAGYDYYRATHDGPASIVQGSRDAALHPDMLVPEFLEQAERTEALTPFPDRLRNLQYRDLLSTKLPRALRFNDRVSMRSSTELREPFLDHRLVELALRQPPERKIRDGVGKRLLRDLAAELLPDGVVEAPKRPLQTPQREWLRGPLRGWAAERIDAALAGYGGTWIDGAVARRLWNRFASGEGDNSFYVWQLISLGLLAGDERPTADADPAVTAVSTSAASPR